MSPPAAPAARPAAAVAPVAAVPRRRYRGLLAAAVALTALMLLFEQQGWWAAALHRLAPEYTPTLYPVPLLDMVLRHLSLVLVSSGATILIGVPLGVWVTRPSGADFRQLVTAAVDLGQTFPPVAVLALAMPVLGLGFWPSIVALLLYGLFPVVSGTVAGIESVPAAVLEAARGMGMGRMRILLGVELPLAATVVMGGIRTSVIINIGTATVAAAVGAGGLGDPIIGGINVQNISFVLEGAIAAALLAVCVDALLAQAERALTPEVS